MIDVSELAEMAAKLHYSTGNLNKVITLIEDLLREKDLFVESSVSIYLDMRLCWKKHLGKWRLLVLNNKINRFELLTHSSREIRIKATSLFPDLLDEIMYSIEFEQKKVDSAIEDCVSFADTLGKTQF